MSYTSSPHPLAEARVLIRGIMLRNYHSIRGFLLGGWGAFFAAAVVSVPLADRLGLFLLLLLLGLASLGLRSLFERVYHLGGIKQSAAIPLERLNAVEANSDGEEWIEAFRSEWDL